MDLDGYVSHEAIPILEAVSDENHTARVRRDTAGFSSHRRLDSPRFSSLDSTRLDSYSSRRPLSWYSH